MKKIVLAALMSLLVSTGALAQNPSDACHVYVVDVERARKVFDDEDFKPATAQEMKKALAGVETVFPEFRTTVGEEILTTKAYPFPGGNFMITASVYYTDESMASSEGVESVMLGVAVSPKALPDALVAENNAFAEVTFNEGTDTVRVKKYAKVGGRLYLVGLECHHKARKPRE